MTFAFQYSGVFSSQPTAHASSGEIATVPHPVADESIMMSSSSAGNPAFAFDPPQDSDSLPADTLAFTLNDDDSIPLDNFFTAGAEDLPELTLPGCGAEDSKELFGNSDTDMTAAAGCSEIAGNAGSGSLSPRE